VAGLRSYAGVRALVTGASSGIGRALALRLAREGARLALIARREPELVELAERVREAGSEAVVACCDVAEPKQVEEAVHRALDGLGGIDLLVNNAGYGHHRPFLDWDVADMERIMRVNYLGALYFTKALLPQMVERGGGWLVFVASVAGKIALPGEAAYTASKFAMVGLASALSLELEEHGVHVLTVCPGTVRTPFFDAEALERMPAVSRREMIEPDALVDAMLAALTRGRRELTVPGWFGAGYVVQALAPAFMRRQIRRSTAVPDEIARGRAPVEG
jgi:short-subunit dehydrogenase